MKINKLKEELKTLDKNNERQVLFKEVLSDFTEWFASTPYFYNLSHESYMDINKPIKDRVPLNFDDIFDEWRFSKEGFKFVK